LVLRPPAEEVDWLTEEEAPDTERRAARPDAVELVNIDSAGVDLTLAPPLALLLFPFATGVAAASRDGCRSVAASEPRFMRLAGVMGVIPFVAPAGTGGGGMIWLRSTGLGVDATLAAWACIAAWACCTPR
jgi:hypothetical protein